MLVTAANFKFTKRVELSNIKSTEQSNETKVIKMNGMSSTWVELGTDKDQGTIK